MNRYIICGQSGSGTEEDPFRPECVDEFPKRTREVERDGETVTIETGVSWAANQEIEAGLSPTPLPRFVVHAPELTEEEFAELAYDEKLNPNGYDWLEENEDGSVTVHAAQQTADREAILDGSDIASGSL